MIPSVEGDHCDACGEVILGREAGDRYGNLVQDFRNRVDALTHPSELP